MATSLLATDGYKFSMAEAGWPLREETFHYAHRKGGLQVLPFDVRAAVERLLPVQSEGDHAFLAQHDYAMGAGYRAALARRSVEVRALPRGASFLPREPVFSVTGPSALVSWLEPLLLQLHYRIQVATLALTDEAALAVEVAVVTCEAQRELVREAVDSVGRRAPPMRVDAEGYVRRVEARVRELVEVVGDGARLFEVGLRAATCLEQHQLALEGCRRAGLTRTSHVLGARTLGLVPVGTMGHEHVQRYGSDEAAFRAMRERRPYRSSFLLDTFDTLTSGIPAALELISEQPEGRDSIRFDSGDKESQYLFAVSRSRERGVRPVFILEDGFDAEQTRRFEALREQVGWRPDEQYYGYGGYLVAQTSGTRLTRDRVSAVYKLSQTGKRPTMKFANEAGSGKKSLPGRPVVFRRRSGTGPLGIVGQEGEEVPEGYALLTGAASEGRHSLHLDASVSPADAEVGLSPATRALVEQLEREAFAGGRR